jgi:hypothetical protein
MVLEVAPDAAQVMAHADVECCEILGVADP